MYFRHLNPVTKKYDNICFEDLPSEAQDEILGKASHEFVRGMVRGLADTLNNI